MSIDTSKIIHAPVGGGRYTVTSPIVKEDYGLYLKIEGLELPTTYEVDFSNSEHNGTSVTMIGNSDGVLIPHQFIDTGKDIFAFLYHVGSDYGRTIFKFRIPNKLRPDRTDDEPTPEEQSVIDQAIVALNSAVAQTAQDVIDADASAQSAQGYAEQAETARDTAQTYANNAQASATSASQSATASANSASASAQSASQSAQIKADVEDMVDDAQGYAQASAQSASASANSASDAQGYANSASASARSASGYASSAQTSAQTASSKAQDASTSAQTASQKATEASQSASQALSYKTDAESAKTASQTAQGLAESARDTAVQSKNDAESARDEAQDIVDGISGKVEQIDANTASIESIEEDRYKPYVTDSASGSIASFSDGADDIPLKSLVVGIDPVQDLHGYDSPWVGGGGVNLNPIESVGEEATVNNRWYVAYQLPLSAGTYYTYTELLDGSSYTSGLYLAIDDGSYTRLGSNSGLPMRRSFTLENDAVIKMYLSSSTIPSDALARTAIGKTDIDHWTPYENICPISGWTGANVWADGKNLFDKNAITENAYLSMTTGLEESTPNYNITDYIAVKKNVPVYIPKTNSTRRWFYDVNKTPKMLFNATPHVIFTPSEDGYIRVTINKMSEQAIDLDTLQIELGSAATDYEPYKGRTIPISWQSEAGTVYGGKLDVLSGVLRVEYQCVKIKDVSSITKPGDAFRTDVDRKADTVYPRSDAYKTVAPTQSTVAKYCISCHRYGTYSDTYRKIVYINDPRYATVEEFVEAMGEHQILFELNTPIEIQLDAHTINSLYGTNNIFADTGDASVEYRADAKLYISRLTEPDADMVADANITLGKYFMVGNNLYLATANIASGSAVIVGTNCIRKSLSEALNEINA